MSTCHVHLGLPKTGSTTFQKALQLNADAVAPHVTVINRMCFGPQRQGLLRAHAHIRNTFASGIDLPVLQTHLETAEGGPLSEYAKDGPVLLTDEGLCGPHLGQFAHHKGGLPALNAALDALAAVLPAGQTVFHIVVRDHKQWVKSLYNQAVKQTGYTGSFEDFTAELPRDFDITHHINALQAAHQDKDIHIHTMESASLFPGQQILLDCGFSPAELSALTLPEKENQSWSKSMLLAMRVINSADIDNKARGALHREFAKQRDLFTDW
ncbi:hypothetical protein [Sulfitobacter sp.]|uniref:hypothetical protein n=1 Tax=Sulfitobacter sp. TaxID=1903071 RepID=UPI00300393CB